MERIIMHIDVNNAFLSWSAVYLLLNGSKEDIRNTYAVIGGDETARKGIVLAKSTPCKKLGITTGETLYSARSKCKSLRVYPPNFKFYTQMSNKLFNIIKNYSPDVEIASIDECYLDYGKVKRLYGDELIFAKRLQKEIYEKLGFTVNIGIANNKLCAKMASDFSKPNKIHTLYQNEIAEKLSPLPVEDLFGIGKQTKIKLNNMGIKTIKDLQEYDLNTLKKVFKNMATYLKDSSFGINNDEVISQREDQKVISNEITLISDTKNKDILLEHIENLCEMTSLRLRKEKKYTSTIAITIKTNNFKRRTHQKTIKNPTNKTSEITQIAKEVFKEMNLDISNEMIRLIGVRLDNLTNTLIEQTSLFNSYNNNDNSNDNLDKVLDELKEKYGYKIINKASNSIKNLSKTLEK